MTYKIHVAADGRRLIRDDNGEQIGRGLARDWEAEKTYAARLALAWNMHDEMAEALGDAFAAFNDLFDCGITAPSHIMERALAAHRSARAVLAKLPAPQ